MKPLLYSGLIAANILSVFGFVAVGNAIFKNPVAEPPKVEARLEPVNPPAYIIRDDLTYPLITAARPTHRPDSIQTKCLALNIYHEARGEPLAGQVNVGFVTLNRVKSKNWADNICGVVYQHKQFSWTYYGNRINFRNSASVAAYDRAYDLAEKIIAGTIDDKSNGSTHYYAPQRMEDQKAPYWAVDYDVVAEIDGHIFLR